MTWLFMGWLFFAALWLLFISTSGHASRHPRGSGHDEVPMLKCPACSRWTAPIEISDFDGVNVHCDRCRAFIGIRPLGSEPKDLVLMDYSEKDHVR